MKLRKPLAMVTLTNSRFAAFAADSVPGKAAYCIRHGYGFFSWFLSDNQDRPASWYRLKTLLECGRAHKWLFCTDADSVIWNPALPLLPHVDEKYELIVTWDGSGLNTGNYFIRLTPWMRRFICDVWWKTDDPDEIVHHTWEQNRLRVLFKKTRELRKRTKVVDQRVFNAFAADPDTIIMHYSGLADLDERLRVQKARDPGIASHPDGNTKCPDERPTGSNIKSS